MSSTNSAHERILSDKYLNIRIYDWEADEIHRVVGVEWKARATGISAHHVLVTQLVSADADYDKFEPDHINNFICAMIADAPSLYNR